MTNDYKEDLLDYMTGELTPGTQTSNYFRDEETITNGLVDRLQGMGITPSYNIRTLRSNFTSNYLLYDNYEKDNKYYSWIAILNQKGEILDILTTYESGTKIEEIISLEYDENGYIYGVDYSNNADKYRIILLNNIAAPIGDNYICKLRSSYLINVNFDPVVASENKTIKKVPGEARYFLFGIDTTDINNRKTKLLEFSNIVGVPLEWNYYLGQNLGQYYVAENDFIIEKENENITLDIYYRVPSLTNMQHEYFDGTQLVLKPEIVLTRPALDIKIEDANNVYISNRKNNGNGTYTIYVYKITNGVENELFNYNVSVSSSDIPSMYLALENGILFTKNEFLNGSSNYNVICCAYYNNTLVKSPTYEYTKPSYLTKTTCNVQKVFNLYTFLVQQENLVHHPKIVIYDNQYSGISYQDYNSLIPAHSEIYSNEYIQFARDLYNKQVFENQTLAVVNVPFNYLNDMTLNPTNLLGQTMTTLVNDKRDITKNKYENVYINFLNKINVVDEDIGKIYPLTANYVNNNINVGTSANYNVSKLTKVRINFSTPQIISINWTKYYSYYKTTFAVQIEDEIPTSIDFISEDETTTYITKEYHFHKNRNYMISEKVRIVNSLQKEELMYNNQNVLYDHNQVMVYEKE